MRLFIASLQSSEAIASDLTDIGLKLTGSVDVTPSSIFWFRPYKATDFPEITCDKDYFFIYSTDHDNSGSTYWGKGDNLDLSDFQEVGVCIDGVSAETPFLYRLNGKVFLYYHPNQGTQRTRAYSTTGGSLSNIGTGTGGSVDPNWTYEDTVIVPESDETHTGYMKMWNNRAIHLAKGGTPALYRFSTTTDGINFIRGADYDLGQGMDPGLWIKATYGWCFKKYGQDWFLGTAEPDTGSSPGTIDKNLVLCKTDQNFQITEQVALLNGGDFTRNYEVYVEGDFAYVYFQNPNDKLYYGKYDLRNLARYMSYEPDSVDVTSVVDGN